MPLIIPSNSITGGYEVDNSLRFDDGSSDYLDRTPSSAGNRKTFTWSFWVKRSDLAASKTLYSVDTASGNTGFSASYFLSTGELFVAVRESSGMKRLQTNPVFRDVSAWYHIVIAFDTTQSTATDRIKLYVNGSQVTSFSLQETITQNFDTSVNNTVTQDIGVYKNSSGTRSSNFDGYMAEVCLIDGQQLDPTSFGEFDADTGIWKPISVSGLTFGTNGFYLPFENSAALGQDDSGNGNNFTVNNLTSIDQTTDTPTNNFATINSLDNFYANSTFSEGNLKIVTSSNETYNTSTIGVSSGKWYFEVEWDATSSGTSVVGIVDSPSGATSASLHKQAQGWGYRDGGNVKNNDIAVSGSWSSYTTGDIIGIALDLDNNRLFFSKNGVWQNSGDPTSSTGAITITAPSSLTNGNYFFAIGDYNTGTSTFLANFGNPPFTISSGNSDGNGYGLFEYQPPSGYLSLCTKNLATDG